MRMLRFAAPAALVIASTLSACSKKASSDESPDTTHLAAAPAAPAPAPAPSTQPTAVRGKIVAATDSQLTVATKDGEVRVKVSAPLQVYKTQPGSLSKVTPNTFVGVTSVAQKDDTQKATEIHIFPEELRGTGEGSNLMGDSTSSKPRSTMTNGSVAASSPSRMTNGTVQKGGDNAITVKYNGSSRDITVPKDVKVTEIVATKDKLKPGASVIVLATKQPDGTFTASRAFLYPGQ